VKIVPGPGDAKGLITHPRQQAKGNPVPTIVLLTTALVAIQIAKAGGDLSKVGLADGVKDVALVGVFVIAATIVPSDLVIAALLVALIYDVVIDPALLDRAIKGGLNALHLGTGSY
jgi:hypothetical protein